MVVVRFTYNGLGTMHTEHDELHNTQATQRVSYHQPFIIIFFFFIIITRRKNRGTYLLAGLSCVQQAQVQPSSTTLGAAGRGTMHTLQEALLSGFTCEDIVAHSSRSAHEDCELTAARKTWCPCRGGREMGSGRGRTSVQQLHVQVAPAASSLPSAVFSLLSVLAGAPKKKPVAGACLVHQAREIARGELCEHEQGSCNHSTVESVVVLDEAPNTKPPVVGEEVAGRPKLN